MAYKIVEEKKKKKQITCAGSGSDVATENGTKTRS